MAAATGRKELAALREYAYSLVLDMAASSVESVRHREASAPGLDGVTPSCHLKATANGHRTFLTRPPARWASQRKSSHLHRWRAGSG